MTRRWMVLCFTVVMFVPAFAVEVEPIGGIPSCADLDFEPSSSSQLCQIVDDSEPVGLYGQTTQDDPSLIDAVIEAVCTMAGVVRVVMPIAI